MKNLFGEKKYPYAFLYVWATLICLFIVFGYVCINGGSALSQWFFSDIWDTGNDFFNCIPAVKGYGLGYWLVGQYPPMAKLFFLLVAHIYSHNNISLDAAIRNSITDPRMQQAALVPFIMFLMLMVIFIIALVSSIFKEEPMAFWIGSSVIGTYSILFAVERGNIILLSFLFLMYFIAYYKSENKILKETAFWALAISAGLKLYPAAFGILLLYEKRWKEAARTILYGILALIIPYLLVARYLPAGEVGSVTSSVVEWAKKLAAGLFSVRSLPQQIFFAGSIIIALIGMIFISIKGNKKNWVRMFYAGILAMICGIQFIYAYTYIFMIPALILFLKEERKLDVRNGIYFVLFCIINLPLPIFGAQKYETLPVVGDIKMWGLFVMMILLTVMECFVHKKSEK